MNKRKSRTLKWFMCFWAILLLSFCAAISMRVNEYGELAEKEAQVRILLEEEDKISAELMKDKDYYESDVFVEKIAREQLELVYPDEYLFYSDAQQ